MAGQKDEQLSSFASGDKRGWAEERARADAEKLSQIENTEERRISAAAIASAAEIQPAYQEALISNHQAQALEVAGHAQYSVARYTPRKGSEVLHFGNDAAEAMLRYAQESKRDFIGAQPAGANVTLTDIDLKLDAARTSEGQDAFNERFGKEEGRAAYAAAQATLAERATESPSTSEELRKKHERFEAVQDSRPVEVARTRDSNATTENLELNTLEPGYARQAQQLDGEGETKRAAGLNKSKGQEGQDNPQAVQGVPVARNDVESDEIFTATQRQAPLVPVDVEQRFVRKGDKFYNQPDGSRLEFEDKGNRLETRSDGAQVAGAMVRIAEARGWDEIKVHGSEAFRRDAWIEAAACGMHVKGYSPTEQDRSELAKRHGNAVAMETEKGKELSTAPATPAAEAESPNRAKAREFTSDREEAVRQHPELAGAAAASVAIARRAQADGLTPQQQAVVQARVHQNLVNTIERGNPPRVEIREEVERAVETTREVAR